MSCGVVLLGAGVAHGVEPLTFAQGSTDIWGKESSISWLHSAGPESSHSSECYPWYRSHIELDEVKRQHRIIY